MKRAVIFSAFVLTSSIAIADQAIIMPNTETNLFDFDKAILLSQADSDETVVPGAFEGKTIKGDLEEATVDDPDIAPGVPVVPTEEPVVEGAFEGKTLKGGLAESVVDLPDRTPENAEDENDEYVVPGAFKKKTRPEIIEEAE